MQKEIGIRAKEKKDFADLKAKKEEMEAQIKALEVDVVRLEEEVQSKLNTIGNIVHDSVKVSNNEDDNPVVRTWGEHVPQPKFLHHYDVLAKLDAYDAERGIRIYSF